MTTEGDDLLCDGGLPAGARGLRDEARFLDRDDQVWIDALIARQVAGRRDRAAATVRAPGSDQCDAVLVGAPAHARA